MFVSVPCGFVLPAARKTSCFEAPLDLTLDLDAMMDRASGGKIMIERCVGGVRALRAVVAAAACLWLLSPGDVCAEARLSYREAAKQLDSTQLGQVRRALEAFKAQKTPRAGPLIAKRIKAGLPPPLLFLAIDTVAALPRGHSSSVLFDLMKHRSVDVRVRSIEASVKLSLPGSDRALIKALDDGDAEVRIAAVRGLAQIKSRRALPSLFLAFERQVPHAAEALGQVAGQPELQRILGYLDELSFRQVAPILRGLLDRDEVPDRLKVQIISRLEQVNTAEVSFFLRGFLDDYESAEDDTVRQAALDTLDALSEAQRNPDGESPEQEDEQGGTP